MGQFQFQNCIENRFKNPPESPSLNATNVENTLFKLEPSHTTIPASSVTRAADAGSGPSSVAARRRSLEQTLGYQNDGAEPIVDVPHRTTSFELYDVYQVCP
jgi:hypothetical protein